MFLIKMMLQSKILAAWDGWVMVLLLVVIVVKMSSMILVAWVDAGCHYDP